VTGLYIADASVLPTSVGVNPMMTIIACATHVARDVGSSLAG
jgi:choline dehydrogenase-like flavoprotein